jgi:hypothetical protein
MAAQCLRDPERPTPTRQHVNNLIRTLNHWHDVPVLIYSRTQVVVLCCLGGEGEIRTLDTLRYTRFPIAETS